MTAHSRVARPLPRKGAVLFRGLLALIFMLSLVGILPPEPAQAAPDAPQVTTIIAALSDYGSGTTLEGTVATMIAGWSPARIVTAGDNYHYQSCNSYATCVGNYYGTYVTAQTFMPTLGNHDYDTPPVGLVAYNNYFTWLPTSPDAQRRWYDFVVGDVHFFMLDGNGNQSTQSAWLATAVPASTSTWNIAVLHQAPYSTGYYGDIAASQLTYGTYGIDFVISGHNHHYQRLVKADGGKTVRYFIDGYGGTDAANHSECGTHTSSATSEACLADVPGALKITASDTSIMFQYYSSSGVLQDTYTQDAEPTGPSISTSVSTLSAFSTAPGTPSVAQTYTVSGSNLTADISVAAPVGFELSTNGSTYASGLTLPQSGGAVGTTTIYARLTGAAEGSFSGNIAHTSSGATQKDVAVSGTVALCSTVSFQQGSNSYTGARDTHIRQANVTYNYGVATPLMVDSDEPNGSGNDVSALLYWDLSAIPAGSTVQSASVTVYVENVTESPGYNMYDMTQAWTEGTGNGSATANGATWNTYNGSNAWPGGAGGASDKGSTVLANFMSTATGSYQATLNAAGATMLEGWINTPANNKGFMIHAGSTANGLDFTSKNGSTVANRPKLNVTYCVVSTGPTIITTGTLTPFSTPIGTPSAAQTYSVSGSNLTTNISIAAPTGFEISTDGSTYSPSLSLTQSGGTVPSTPIYVRLTGAEGVFGGNITHTSTGATTKNVAASGTAAVYYTLTVNAGSGGGVTLNPTGGSYASGTVVTLSAVAATGYIFYGWSGDVSGNTNPATITMNGNKFVTATFVAGTCSTANLIATEDTYLSANDVQYNNGGNVELHVDATTSTARRTALLKWNLSTIPTAATVSAASLSLYVEDASPLVFNLYNLRRTWVEGTSSQANSTSSANWNTWNGTTSWGTVGAANTSTDRYDANLWSAGTTSFSTTGAKTLALNPDGVAVVQGWVSGSTSNYGLIMQNYSAATGNAVYFTSSEGTPAANRPILNVTYCALSYTPAKPKPPAVTVIALSGSNDVDLTWDAVTQDVNDNPTTITKYQVYGSHDPFFAADISTLLPEQPTPPWATTFTHTGGSTGTTNWYYLVRAVNIAGESVDSPRRTGRFGFALVPGN